MQLVFPTNCGTETFYTVVNLKDVEIDSVEIVENIKPSQPNTFLMSKQQSSQEFSIDELNQSFHNKNTLLNNSIDSHLLNKINNK